MFAAGSPARPKSRCTTAAALDMERVLRHVHIRGMYDPNTSSTAVLEEYAENRNELGYRSPNAPVRRREQGGDVPLARASGWYQDRFVAALRGGFICPPSRSRTGSPSRAGRSGRWRSPARPTSRRAACWLASISNFGPALTTVTMPSRAVQVDLAVGVDRRGAVDDAVDALLVVLLAGLRVQADQDSRSRGTGRPGRRGPAATARPACRSAGATARTGCPASTMPGRVRLDADDRAVLGRGHDDQVGRRDRRGDEAQGRRCTCPWG